MWRRLQPENAVRQFHETLALVDSGFVANLRSLLQAGLPTRQSNS